MKILVVEDEKYLNRNIKEHLLREGYLVDHVYDGAEALTYCELYDYDAIVLDLMMPHMDGMTFLKKIRHNKNNTPVLILSAKSDVNDRILALDEGADDYLGKPFSLKELSARLRVLIRRHHQKGNSALIEHFLFKLDMNAHQVIVNEETIALTSKEYAILEYLLLNQGIIISRERLMDHIWEYDYDGTSNIIDVYIRTLRKKIGKDAIETVRGVGYVIR